MTSKVSPVEMFLARCDYCQWESTPLSSRSAAQMWSTRHNIECRGFRSLDSAIASTAEVRDAVTSLEVKLEENHFENWLDEVKQTRSADAWDKGFEAGITYANSPAWANPEPNPYREGAMRMTLSVLQNGECSSE